MRANYLFVLIHISYKREAGTNQKCLSPPVKMFFFITCRSKAVILLLFVFAVCQVGITRNSAASLCRGFPRH